MYSRMYGASKSAALQELKVRTEATNEGLKKDYDVCLVFVFCPSSSDEKDRYESDLLVVRAWITNDAQWWQ